MERQNRSENRRRIVLSKFQRELEEPNWIAWKKVKSAPLWELVAISCGIEPQELRSWKDTTSGTKAPKIFADRLRLAESILSIHGGGLACIPEGLHSCDARVELGNFRVWLEHEGCTLPSKFPKHTPKTPPKELHKDRQLRLTQRIEEVRTNQNNYMAVVAKENNITIQRLQQIVGTVQERKQRLAQTLK